MPNRLQVVPYDERATHHFVVCDGMLTANGNKLYCPMGSLRRSETAYTLLVESKRRRAMLAEKYHTINPPALHLFTPSTPLLRLHSCAFQVSSFADHVSSQTTSTLTLSVGRDRSRGITHELVRFAWTTNYEGICISNHHYLLYV